MHTYRVQLEVDLTPVALPSVVIGVDNNLAQYQLTGPRTFVFDYQAEKSSVLVVKHVDKAVDDAETAVIIDRVRFFGISDDRFVWQGTYTPLYPQPWYQQQVQQGSTPLPVLTRTNYLGWNGEWRLDFSVPVFTWMHSTLDLGWLYV